MALMSKPIATDPKLLELLKRAAGHKMTRAEKDAQQKSWVIGNMLLDHPEMTREHAERIYSEVMGK